MIEFSTKSIYYVIVNKNDENIADLFKTDGIWVVDELYNSLPSLTAQELRQIADKLDELNNDNNR